MSTSGTRSRVTSRASSSTFCGWLTNWAFAAVAFPIPWILLLFPDGRLPTPRWRPVAIAMAALEAFLLVGLIVNPGPIDIDFAGPIPMNPTGIPALEGILRPAADRSAVSRSSRSASPPSPR